MGNLGRIYQLNEFLPDSTGLTFCSLLRENKIKTICHPQREREQCAYIKNKFSPALLPYLQKIN